MQDVKQPNAKNGVTAGTGHQRKPRRSPRTKDVPYPTLVTAPPAKMVPTMTGMMKARVWTPERIADEPRTDWK